MEYGFLKNLDFDLAYLALLTQRGIKPLSRCEEVWSPEAEYALNELGLEQRCMHRTACNGRVVKELIFSCQSALLDEYALMFDEKPLYSTPDTIRSEGRFFGYPSCCVESFIRRGYLRNSMLRRDQRILFHWACPHCTVTPQLIGAYREVYKLCRRNRGIWLPDLRVGPYAEAVHQRAVEVASWAALLTLVSAASLVGGEVAPLADLSHMLSVADDSDADGLMDVEEAYFNTRTNIVDSNGNALPDGYDVAYKLWQEINALPRGAITNAPYVVEAQAKGTVRCEICGEIINMGYLTVFNPVEETEVRMPLLAMHFMEHGSFAHDGDLDGEYDGRVDPRRIDTVVNNHPSPRIKQEQGVFKLHWHGLDEKSYRMNTTVDLRIPWTPGPVYEGNDAEIEHVDSGMSPSNKFFRLSWE